MKFSEAILLGSTKTKEARRFFLSKDGSCGCAIGGAAAAVGISSDEIISRFGNPRIDTNAEAWLDWVGSTWRWTRQLRYCPACPAPSWWARWMGQIHIARKQDGLRRSPAS